MRTPGGRGGGRDNHDDGDEPQGSLQNVVARTGTQRLNLAPSTGESVRVRTRLAGGGKWIRTLGPGGAHHFSASGTDRAGGQNRILTIDKGRFARRRAGSTPATISTPGFWKAP